MTTQEKKTIKQAINSAIRYINDEMECICDDELMEESQSIVYELESALKIVDE